MSWLVKLYETYNNCEEYIGEQIEGKRPLLPAYHSSQTAHIEITIDEYGEFAKAELIPKQSAATIIPVTEKSSSRTSSPIPHALNDSLQYIAGDLAGKAKKDYSKHYNLYLEQLSEWHNFDRDNKNINAVLKYVEKKCIAQDILSILPELSENEDISKLFCRFNVMVSGETEIHTYKDQNLFDSWTRFQDSVGGKTGLCYATGEVAQIASSHSKYIRNTGDGAKLISSNDDTVVTYKGRFTSADEACEVGSVVSHKAHSALKWLISRQGYNRYGHTILAWADKNIEIPNPMENELIDDEDLGLDLIDDEGLSTNDSDIPMDAAQSYALRLNKKIAGYKQKLDPRENINIIALDSATPGRLAIIYYSEKGNEEYFNKLEEWYKSCCWHMRNYVKKDKASEGKWFSGVSTPSPIDIIQAAYGLKADDNIKHATILRLLPCIADGATIPSDIAMNAVARTSNRAGYQTDDTDKNETNWNRGLQTTCALYKKLKIKENYDMALEETRRTRDYLYGRLLAVGENIESWALNESGENRPTSASRYFAQFAAQPYRTWLTIEKSIKPYIDKLEGKATGRIRLIDEIMNMFDYDDFVSNRQLSGEFLLGYHTQRRALYEKNNTANGENADK